VGLPGETVALKNGVVFINGKPFVETHTMNRDSFNMKPVKVPDKCYFMMGDNRPDSADSRYWGFITENDIIGRAVLRIWPLTQISLIPGK
jgi:signal peptidase I